MPATSSVHAQTAGRPGIARSGAAMLAASGMKRTRGKENSVAGSGPDLMVRRLSPAARLAQKQPHARDSERSGQENVKNEPRDRRLQIGLVIAVKERQSSG